MDDRGSLFIKQSRFSHIKPIDGITRLIVYSSSNVAGLEGIIHRGSKVIVEVADGSMIVFTNETFHAGVKSYLRLFAYIVDNNYVSITDEVFKILNKNICNLNCPTCEEIPNENIHYEGHVIKYLDT